MRWFYTLVFYLSLPLILARLLWRARKAPAYARRWGERFGLFPPPGFESPVIWVHAVSVGESIAAAPLLKALMQRHPKARLVVTTTTPTGSAQVRKLFGDSVFHVYAPYDLPICLKHFLKRIKPTCLIVMETELWPNTIALCRKRGIPVILANGRLSQKSADGYRRIAWLMRPALQNLSAAAMQHNDDVLRMQSLGLPADKCHITGNIKFDLTISDERREQAASLKASINQDGERLIWIAASTHRGEDEIILSAFSIARERIPQLFLILVPRHPERFADVTRSCEALGYAVERRSTKAEGKTDTVNPGTNILIGDTMGELLTLFGAADIAFVGGSLVPVGGHNLIEPAAWGLPIITGRHLFNFAEAARLLQGAEAMLLTEDEQSLAEQVIELSVNQDKRRQMGENAQAVARANRGALEKLLGVAESYCA